MANKITEELKKEQEKVRVSYFWGLVIAIVSIMQGTHILFYDGVLAERLNVYLLEMNEDIFGLVLVLFGVIKLLGVISDSFKMRAIGIVGLSITWGMLTAVAFMFSFGIGYPNTAYISNGFMMVACLRVSYKGASR